MDTERLASFVVDTADAGIPAEAIDAARHAITDTVGCALAGVQEPVAELAASWLRDLDAHPRCTVWGTDLATSAAEAAFANSISSHALDFDDSLATLRGHPSATLAPTALAVGQVAGSSGRAVLEAFVLGLEVAGKLGNAVGDSHYLKGWHTTATVGALASTAVAGRLWGLTPAEMQIAFGLAASQAAGLVRNFGTMAKSFHAGSASRSGILSAWMAGRGFTADPGIFDGRNNFLATYGSEQKEPLSAILGRLGQPWEILDPGILVKRWPCCFANHRPIGGMLKLAAEHGIAADEIEAIEIGFLPGGDSALLSENPQTGLEAKFSIEYVAAATMLDGDVTLDSFTDPMVMRPGVRELMAKVRRQRIESSGVYSGLVGYTDVAIATQRGRFSMRVDQTPGSRAWPMTGDERVAKFTANAQRVLGSRNAARLLELLDGLEQLPSVVAVAEATIPAARERTAGAAASAAVA